jgi:hypothetical protein
MSTPPTEKSADVLAPPPHVLDVELEQRLQADLGADVPAQAPGKGQPDGTPPDHRPIDRHDPEGEQAKDDKGASLQEAAADAEPDPVANRAGVPVPWEQHRHDRPQRVPPTGALRPGGADDANEEVAPAESAASPAESGGDSGAEHATAARAADAAEVEADDPPLLTPEEIALLFGEEARGNLNA